MFQRAISQLESEKRENERKLEDSVRLLFYTKSSCFQCFISFQKRNTTDKKRELTDVLVSLSVLDAYLLLFSHKTDMVLFQRDIERCERGNPRDDREKQENDRRRRDLEGRERRLRSEVSQLEREVQNAERSVRDTAVSLPCIYQIPYCNLQFLYFSLECNVYKSQESPDELYHLYDFLH